MICNGHRLNLSKIYVSKRFPARFVTEYNRISLPFQFLMFLYPSVSLCRLCLCGNFTFVKMSKMSPIGQINCNEARGNLSLKTLVTVILEFSVTKMYYC